MALGDIFSAYSIVNEKLAVEWLYPSFKSRQENTSFRMLY